MIEYRYTRYRITKDGKTEANTADLEQAKNIASAINGAIEEYTASDYISRKQLEKTAYNKAISDMEIVLYNSKQEIRQEIKRTANGDLLKYIEG